MTRKPFTRYTDGTTNAAAGGSTQTGGYAAPPGTGPKGETCGTCNNLVRRGYHNRTYYKCALVPETRGAGTDIRMKTAACIAWKGGEE